MRGEGNSVVGMGIGSAVVATAGINHVANGVTGAADATSHALGSAVAAGQYAWDADGNFVCSRFVFNFRTGEIFDSIATYKATSIDRIERQNNTIKIYRGVNIHTIPVGMPQRADAAMHLIDLMRQGIVLEPEGKRIKSFNETAGKLGAVRIVAYLWLSMLAALPLSMIYGIYAAGSLSATFSWFDCKVAFFLSFAVMVGLHKLKPVRRPTWSAVQ